MAPDDDDFERLTIANFDPDDPASVERAVDMVCERWPETTREEARRVLLSGMRVGIGRWAHLPRPEFRRN